MNRLKTPQEVTGMAEQLEAAARGIAAAVGADIDSTGNVCSGPCV